MTPKKLLVVDDEQDIVDLISYNLKKEGYTVLTATNGTSALEIAKQELPDLIILDIMMPGLDGFEVCRMFRQYPQTSQV